MGRFTDFELQDIETTFVDELASGGLPAAERYVDRLTIEALATAEFSRVVHHMERYESIVDIYPIKTMHDAAELLDAVSSTKSDHQLAVRRRKFAASMLRQVVAHRADEA